MNALDLVKSWPALQTLTPDAILVAPAWRASVTFEDKPASLVRLTDETPADELLLSVSFDGEPHVLGLRDAECFSDLHLLWAKRAGLPETLQLALVEKECGGVLQMLENLARDEVKLLGLADRTTSEARHAFQLSAESRPLLSFSLDLPAKLAAEFGQLENLDPSHESIRTLTRPIRAHYATLALSAEEAAQLQPGDFLMIESVEPQWIVGEPRDAAVHLVAATESTAAFAAFADDALPAIPEIGTADLILTRLGRPLCKVTLTQVGNAPAVKILK